MTKRLEKRGNEAGVTLLELLIAVTLVGLLSVGMALALRISLDGSKKVQDHISGNRRVLGVERVMREQIANLMPVFTVCQAGQQTGAQPMPLFEGLPNAMRLVSSYSLTDAGRGYPRLLEYQVIPGENGVGVRLVVNELVWTGPVPTRSVCNGIGTSPEGLTFARFFPIEVGPTSFVLADKLAYCHLSYRELRPAPQFERWVDQWFGANQWPAAVRIDMAPLTGSRAQLQPSSLTISVRAARDLTREYTD